MEDDSQSSDSIASEYDPVSHLFRLMPENFPLSQKCCIFKMPNILYRHNPQAFVPHAFSIGPWHHGTKEHLKRGEEIKLIYLKHLISGFPSPGDKLRELIQAIKDIEERVRAQYAEEIDMDADSFVELLVIDGCFIIEVFRKYSKEPSCNGYDPIFHMPCMFSYLLHDLILLENQIPWLVLEELFNMTMETGSSSLAHLGIMFFRCMFSSTSPPSFTLYKGKNHILDLLREWLVSWSVKEGEAFIRVGAFPSLAEEGELVWKPMPSAQSLKEAGIKFKIRKSQSILDVKFVDGVLEVPSLLIQETTGDIFRNLISFEQCYSECPARITSYAVLLDNLINTEKDFKILCEEGIIENWLNPKVATQFFNELYRDAYLKEYYYNGTCVEVKKYCSRRWPRWRAAYLQNYFGTPWAIASQVVAVVVLILAFLQTLFTIIK